MKLFLILSFLLLACQKEESKSSKDELPKENSKREFTYTEGDTTYTMKQYVMCFLNRGPKANDYDSIQLAEIQNKHIAHIKTLANDGKILIAGPFSGDTDKRGVLIFDVETVEEAEKLASMDPAVIAGRLSAECLVWWAAKGSVLK
jgi:uncharacterized protein